MTILLREKVNIRRNEEEIKVFRPALYLGKPRKKRKNWTLFSLTRCH